MTLFATGAAGQRGIRSSQLLLGWRARDRSVGAYTGQAGRFYVNNAPGTTGAPVVGRNGTSIVGGHGMPRWEQVAGEGSGYGATPALTRVTRLGLVGDVGGQDTERWELDWMLRVMALSYYVRTWPGYGAAADVGAAKIVHAISNENVAGGAFSIQRIGNSWRATRTRPGMSTLVSDISADLVTAYPVDCLATLSSLGAITLAIRDALGVIRTGGTQTDPLAMNPVELWGGPMAYAVGGKFRYEEVKIARGVLSFAQLDALT